MLTHLPTMLQTFVQTLLFGGKASPVLPHWYLNLNRGLILLFLLLTPLLYDITVPEVAGDIRWYAVHAIAMLSVVLLLFAWLVSPRQPLCLHFTLPVWLALGLVVTATISFIDTLNPYRSWFAYKHFLAYLALFGFVLLLRDVKWYRALTWVLILTILPVSLLGIAQFMDWQDADFNNWTFGLIDWAVANYPQSARPAGTFANKNLVASWLVAVLPFTLYHLFTAKRLAVKSLAGVLFTVGMIHLVFTRSRASYIALLVALVCFIGWVLLTPALRQQFKAVVWQHVLPLLGFSLLVIGYCFPIVSPVKGSHGIGLSVAQQVENLQNLSDYGPRIAYNINGLYITLQNPLTGVGIGAYHTAYPWYHNVWYPTPRNGYNVEARPERTHNDLMQAFNEHGIPGGLLHLALIITMLYLGWRLSRGDGQHTPHTVGHIVTQKAHQKADLLPAFTTMSIFGFCFNALGDFPLQMPTGPIVLFTCCGMLSGLALLHGATRPIGTAWALPAPKFLRFGLLSLCAVAAGWLLQDNYYRWRGAQALKPAMSLAMGSNIGHPKAMEFIDEAYRLYPWDARMHEFRGIIYTHNNGNGDNRVTQQRRLEVLRESRRYEPYAANHAINLAGLLHQVADRQQNLKDTQGFRATLAEIDDLITLLLRVAPFSHFTWDIKALSHLKRNQPEEAFAAVRESMNRNPQGATAQKILQEMVNRGIIRVASPTTAPQQ